VSSSAAGNTSAAASISVALLRNATSQQPTADPQPTGPENSVSIVSADSAPLITLHRCNRVRRVRASLIFVSPFESIHLFYLYHQKNTRVSTCLGYEYVPNAHSPAYSPILNCIEQQPSVHDHNASKTPSKSVCQLP
jgi:hypothetical protein